MDIPNFNFKRTEDPTIIKAVHDFNDKVRVSIYFDSIKSNYTLFYYEIDSIEHKYCYFDLTPKQLSNEVRNIIKQLPQEKEKQFNKALRELLSINNISLN